MATSGGALTAPAAARRALSVVVPTYQRRESVRRLLEALGRQTLPSSDYEVIVSIDGATDGTREMLAELRPAFRLHTVSDHPNRGRATACNRGIRASRGDIVVILDDDMEPSPTLLEHHLRQHAGRTRCAVLGAVPILWDESSTAVVRYVGAKFNAHLAKLARPGTRIHCRDFYSGNLSVRRDVLIEAGLFDESFTVYGNEDVDLALRLIERNVELVYAADALARQHYEKAIDRLAADETSKGRSAVLVAVKHPESLPYLKLAGYANGPLRWRLARRILIAVTRVVPSTARAVVGGLTRLENRRSRRVERYLPSALDYFFWLGASSVLDERGIPVATLQARVRTAARG